MTDNPVTLTAAFTLGLLSATHCLGMCGGIVGALSLSLPEPVRRRRHRQILFIALYNLGRIGSYALAGALAGGLGAELLQRISPEYGHTVLRYLGAFMLIAIGLYLAGWLPQMARLESLGIPLWRRLEPLGRRLLPVRGAGQAFAYGLVWGWLPCGMVYSLALWSTTSGSALGGAATMAAFGLGSLPAMLISGVMAQRFAGLFRAPKTRRLIGLALGLMAIATLYAPLLVEHVHIHAPVEQASAMTP